MLVRWAILLPLFRIVRGVDILFFHRNRIDDVNDSMEQISRESVDAFREEINYVGLDKRCSPSVRRSTKNSGLGRRAPCIGSFDCCIMVS